jgi:hypothetical protein
LDTKPDLKINTGMTILHINTGTSANKGDGDSLRTAFNKINANFTYLSTATGGGGGGGAGNGSTGDLVITDATISTALANENIVFDPNGTGRVRFQNTIIQFDNGSTGNPGQGLQILQTRGSGTAVGLGIDTVNSSLRIIGDKQQLGTLADFGLYTGALDSWASKVFIDYHGNITAQGNITSQGALSVHGDITTAQGGISAHNDIITQGNISAGGKATVQGGVTATGYIKTLSGYIFPNNTIQTSAYIPSIATTSTLGSIIVGKNLSVTPEGLLSSTFTNIATTASLGLVKIGNGLNVTVEGVLTVVGGGGGGGSSNLGNIYVDSTALYPNSSVLNIAIGNKDIVLDIAGASYLQLPAIEDTINPAVLSSPNGITIATDTNSTAPILITNGPDGFAPGYLSIGNASSADTSGVYLFSNGGGVDLFANQTLPQMLTGVDTGAVDIYTYSNGNISFRPDGTGTVIVTTSATIRGAVITSVGTPGSGSNATSGDYQTTGVLLNTNKQTQKLSNNDYYLPPGQEGQIMYFVPVNTADTNVRVWIDVWRSMNSGTAVESTAIAWFPFSSSLAGHGISYAVYTDGAWATSHGYTS